MSLAVLAFEGLVAMLLIASAVMSWRLDRRLNALAQGRDAMGAAVTRLAQTTAQAEASVAALRQTGLAASRELDAQIGEARAIAEELRALSTPPRPVREGQTQASYNGFLEDDDDLWAPPAQIRDARASFLAENKRVKA